VVDVTDRADIDVRLGPLELLLRHVSAFTPSVVAMPAGRDRQAGPSPAGAVGFMPDFRGHPAAEPP
jgi:hypothetical protein